MSKWYRNTNAGWRGKWAKIDELDEMDLRYWIWLEETGYLPTHEGEEPPIEDMS